MERVEIALAANDGYFCGLFVTACSIAKYADRNLELRFHILDGGIADNHWQQLRIKSKELHPHVIFNPIPVNEKLFSGYPEWHGNKMAYARLMLPDALPEVDWCIYCDVDFSWLRDIGELWRERDDKYVFIGTKDGVERTFDTEEIWFREKGLPFDRETYFCSGLCLMNLKAFREQNLIRAVFDFLEKYPDVHYPDQNALNCVTYGKRKMVSQRWQRFFLPLTQDDLDAGVVIHHAGDVPWKPMPRKVLLSDARLVWHRLNAEFRGITLWASLRMYFTVGQIVAHRFACLLFRWPLTRHLLGAVFALFLRRPVTFKNYVRIAARKAPARRFWGAA